MPLFRSLLTPPTARTAAALLTVLATSVTLGACTSSGGSTGKDLTGEEGRVQDVIEKFTKFADDDNAIGICRDVFGPQTALDFAGSKAFTTTPDEAELKACAKRVQTLIDATDYTSLTLDSVKITGLTAVATITKTKRATNDRVIVLNRNTDTSPWTITAFGNQALKGSADLAGTTPAGTTPDATPKATPKP